MKVTIIGGGGRVGSNAAFALQCAGVVKEIQLLDYNQEVAEGEALDLLHGAATLGGNIEVRLFKGFSVNMGGRYSWIRDQLFIPLGDATDDFVGSDSLRSMGFVYNGELVEVGPPEQIFEDPRDRRTAQFVAGELMYEVDEPEAESPLPTTSRAE